MGLLNRLRLCFTRGWSLSPPDEAGVYWMRTGSILPFIPGVIWWGLPVRTESVVWGTNGAVRQLDLLTKPRVPRKWRKV